MTDEKMVEALLGISHDHVARFEQMLFAILTGVILKALVIVHVILKTELRLCIGKPVPSFRKPSPLKLRPRSAVM